MKLNSASVVITFSFLLTSCSSLNSLQHRELKEWQAKNIAVEEKNPTTAAVLNILPGIGDFYNGNPGYGVANLLTWPLSILWAPVGGASGADVANYYSSKSYVEDLETKKKKLKNEIESAFIGNQISKQQFFLANKKVDTMNLAEFQKNVEMRDVVPFNPEAEIERAPTSVKK
jgi:hypothetical protein